MHPTAVLLFLAGLAAMIATGPALAAPSLDGGPGIPVFPGLDRHELTVQLADGAPAVATWKAPRPGQRSDCPPNRVR